MPTKHFDLFSIFLASPLSEDPDWLFKGRPLICIPWNLSKDKFLLFSSEFFVFNVKKKIEKIAFLGCALLLKFLP